MGRLAGKVAVVTGAGQGIGRGIARRLAAEGAAVVVSGRTFEKVALVAAEIEESGGSVLAVRCDVNIRTQVDEMVRSGADRFGPPDILVNNAQGGGNGGNLPLESVTDEQLHAAFQGGPMATLYGMQACLPYMRGRGGTIVNMGSSTGVTGDPGFSPYGAAKEAIRGLTKHAAREWGSLGITVNVICPAALSASGKRFKEEAPRRWEAIIKQIPLGYMGDPDDDIAPAVVALATDLRYLTGATLMLDGGRCILR
ncbi:SDR family NAD(P)-dependent oxidoreductase [Streptosporangium sp. NPDC002544]|uniref:SDR family NAD(P)-dependent oxidoreductase n=1 Tax=Streptosporangium sp. NPDC002544 TaxID=3154538 RepID=UPI003326289D